MLDLTDITQIVADSFTGGNTEIAGMLIFTICLAIVFIFVRKAFAALVISLPMSFIFSTLGAIPKLLTFLNQSGGATNLDVRYFRVTVEIIFNASIIVDFPALFLPTKMDVPLKVIVLSS